MPGSISPTVSPRDAFRHSFTLTDQEMEVIEGLCDGLSNRALAANLFISERTVKAHIASIFRKTGTKTRTAIVALAYRALRK
jgi:DNA-binding CsgD family transcriptional regulator